MARSPQADVELLDRKMATLRQDISERAASDAKDYKARPRTLEPHKPRTLEPQNPRTRTSATILSFGRL